MDDEGNGLALAEIVMLLGAGKFWPFEGEVMAITGGETTVTEPGEQL